MGVDPGTHGAVGMFDSECVPQMSVFELPNFTLHVGGKNKARLDLDGVWTLMLGIAGAFDPHLAVLEDVNGYGGNEQQTAASAGVLMATKGALEMALVASQTPRKLITPATWKKHYGITGKRKEQKNAARRIASQTFPDIAHLFGRVKDDGVAEAALLAWYGATQILGYRPQ
jgi:crossover junction endodeoxyribonuclease RuvC